MAAFNPHAGLHSVTALALRKSMLPVQACGQKAPAARQQACTLTLYSDSEDEDGDFKP